VRDNYNIIVYVFMLRTPFGILTNDLCCFNLQRYDGTENNGDLILSSGRKDCGGSVDFYHTEKSTIVPTSKVR